VAEMLARELQKRGRRVAILSRGYKSVPRPFVQRLKNRVFKHLDLFPPRIVSDGNRVLLDSRRAGDEPHMLAKNLPGVCVLVDKDRVKSGLHALRHFDSDVLLLDDGLQYQRLRHRLDVVLVDRQSPFGNEHLLPRGTLREPPANLRRASFIIVTKSGPDPDEQLINRLRKLNPTAAIIECDHAPRHWHDIRTGEKLPLDHLKGRHVGAMSGIARPESFEEAVRRLGANVEITKAFADHHRFTKKEIYRFLEWCDRRSACGNRNPRGAGKLGKVCRKADAEARTPCAPAYLLTREKPACGRVPGAEHSCENQWQCEPRGEGAGGAAF